MSYKITTAMILAAGRGERLRPLTDTTPKPLIKVAGKHLIEYHIENLVSAGIEHIVINTAWLAEKIHQTLGDGSSYGVRINYSDETKALETAGGIIQALPQLGKKFIVVNGDIWCDFDYAHWINKSLHTQAHLLLTENPEHNQKGDFAVELGLAKNSGNTMYTYSGTGLYTAKFFKGMAPGKQALAPIIRNKIMQGLVSAEIYRGRWLDAGTLPRIQQLEALLQK